MVTLVKGAAIKGPIYSLRENGIQHDGQEFHLLLSTFQGSRFTLLVTSGAVCLASLNSPLSCCLRPRLLLGDKLLPSCGVVW